MEKERKKKGLKEKQDSCRVNYRRLNEQQQQHVTKRNEKRQNGLVQDSKKENS